MKKYFILALILFSGFAIVEGQVGNLGVPTPYPAILLLTITGTPSANYDGFGYRVANAGDVDGDGFEDIIIPSYSNGVTSGLYLYVGGSTSNSFTFPLVNMLETDILNVDSDLLKEIVVGDIGGPLASVGSPTAPVFSPGIIRILKTGGFIRMVLGH